MCASSLLLLAGCADASPASDADLTVAAAFYALEYVAAEVGGEHVDVIALASPGVEPHDLELSPNAVRKIAGADLVLYLEGFQPAIDDAVANTEARTFDAATAVTLRPADADEHEGEDHHQDDGHDHGDNDPHFWLDTELLATYGAALAEEFAELDPAHAQTYTANAQRLEAELDALDKEFEAGLAQCARDYVVTSHEAFGYLTSRYHLTQVGITGIDPETEPSPARLLEIRELVRSSGATTIFTESLVNPAVAEAIARDTGAVTAVLDPVESVTGDDDYPAVMERNLAALREGLGCE